MRCISPQRLFFSWPWRHQVEHQKEKKPGWKLFDGLNVSWLRFIPRSHAVYIVNPQSLNGEIWTARRQNWTQDKIFNFFLYKSNTLARCHNPCMSTASDFRLQVSRTVYSKRKAFLWCLQSFHLELHIQELKLLNRDESTLLPSFVNGFKWNSIVFHLIV